MVTWIMVHDLIENEVFSIKMKGKNFTLNLLKFDNSEVEYDEIKNSDSKRI